MAYFQQHINWSNKMRNKKYKLMYQACEIVEQGCESSEWVELKEGTFKEYVKIDT
jgi:hypothetical protein